MSQNKILLEKVEDAFFKKLQQKTNWGRKQIKAAFNEAKTESLIELIELP